MDDETRQTASVVDGVGRLVAQVEQMTRERDAACAVAERAQADASTTAGEVVRLRAALAEMAAIVEGRMTPPTDAMSERITADKARELLARWPARPAVEFEDTADGAHIGVRGSFFYELGPDGEADGTICVDDGEAAMLDAAPALAATVIAQADEIARLRATLALSQESLAAAVRGERVTVADEVERLTRERDVLVDAARAYVAASDDHERASRSGGTVEAYETSAARIVETTEALRALVEASRG